MTIVIQAILEKGIVEYSIVHTVILEYFTIADKVRMFYVCCTYHSMLSHSNI
jgi:pumilio homology domain family member 6